MGQASLAPRGKCQVDKEERATLAEWFQLLYELYPGRGEAPSWALSSYG